MDNAGKAQCLALANDWINVNCFQVLLAALGFLLYFCQFDDSKNLASTGCDLPSSLAPEGADTSWATWALRALNAVRGTQMLVRSPGLPPSDPSAGPSIPASCAEPPVFLPRQLFFLAQLFPVPGCIITPEAASRPLLHPEPLELSPSSLRAPGLRLRVLSSFFPLSLRLYSCVTSSLCCQ